jgi:poly(3-hydroxybutyrate) depolymerase
MLDPSAPWPSALAVPAARTVRRVCLGLFLSASCAQPYPPSDCGDESADTCRVDRLTVDGKERTWVVSAKHPPDCAAGKVPLIVFFHGSESNGIWARTDYAYFEDAIGSRARFVYPDALPREDLGNNQWVRTPDGIDVHFIDALLPVLTQDSCVDPSRVFAVGHSRGGRFNEVLGCYRPSAFRGFAAVSAGSGNVADCPGQAPFWISHGRDDQSAPYAEGLEMRDRWARRNGCALPAVEPPVGTCVALDCPSGLPVSWCPYEGETWRGHFPPPFLGTEVWAFFERL